MTSDQPTQKTFEEHIIIDADNTLAIDALAKATSAQEPPLSKQHLKQVMQKGAVWLTPAKQSNDKRQRSSHTQRLRRAKKALKAGDTLHLYHNPDILNQQPQNATLISDGDEYSVWHKPYGMLSQGSKWSDHTTITRWAEQHISPERPAFLVHRLDRATTGLMVVAHTKAAARHLTKAFELRQTEKHYKAIVEGHFAEPCSCELDIDGRSAKSHFSLDAYDPDKGLSRVDVRIETGRKHQIRRHLAHLGFPILGDRLYGTTHTADLQLCACQLSFPCPRSGELKHFSLAPQRQPQLENIPHTQK